MAKWKNALLISTIVAPIAFGAGPIGDALADATKPSTTTVKLHKYVTDSETDYDNTKYWGNGTTTDAKNPMTANSKWTLGDKATFEFDAYQIPDKAITLHKDGSITFNTVSGVDYDELLEAVDASATNTATSFTAEQYAADGVLSKYAIEVKEGKLAALQAAVGESKAHASTTNTGIASLNLANGNWLIVETTAANSVSDPAVPTVLMLPMQNPNTTGDKWFGTASGSELNLYLKNLTEQGELTVQKLDPETGKGVAGAHIALLKLNGEYTQSDLQNLIDEDFYNLASDELKLKALEEVAVPYVPDNWEGEGDYPNPVVTTAPDGKASFADLMPESDYYVLELEAPKVGDKQYVPNGDVQKVRPSVQTADKDDTDANGDGVYYYTGGTYNLENYDTPLIDKKINVGEYDKTHNVTDANNDFKDDDDSQGISRGQKYQYSLQSDLNGNLEDYTSYKITDTIPYQININEFEFGVKDSAGEYHALFEVGSSANAERSDLSGGDAGNGVYYDSSKATGGDGSEQNPYGGTDAATFTFATGALEYLATLNLIPAQGQTDQEFIASLLKVTGNTSKYEFDKNNRVVEDGATPGNLTLTIDPALLKALGEGNNPAITDAGGSFITTMTAQANSAAQVGEIDNQADLEVKTKYDTTTDDDKSDTFVAGWEFVKSAGDSLDPEQRLAGAGFDLGRYVKDDATKTNVEDNMLSGTNLETAITPTNLVKMGQALVDDGTWYGGALEELEDAVKSAYSSATPDDTEKADAVKALLDAQAANVTTGEFVYFAHLTFADEKNPDNNKQPVLDMIASSSPMGDIFWTLYPALATTHTTAEDGYLQYCGLPAGDYKLIESQVPNGYAKMDDQLFLLSNDAQATSETVDNMEFVAINGKGTDNKILGLNSDDSIVDGEDGYGHLINYEKSIFPLVGGLGTLFAVIAGLLAMGLALLKRKKDMKNEA
ncbi:SpaA isopeptide-forming pilin-related protein [Weissella confusa]|uniref:SpaA isopeptide-forming pilin-related protein n=1 Tax=Weissella confusa TaxID=1583 RepID=UPI00223C0A99|nr:SpaA isopeptide-forming pilin-related protein [Weissella confusa]MCT0015204.1 hypothetical protein [Weissella confusa]